MFLKSSAQLRDLLPLRITAMDILRAGRPAVVVPYSEGREDEQLRRAERLEAMGVVRVLDPSALAPETFADAVARAAQHQPRPHGLDLEGAERTARIVEELVAAVPA